MTEPKHRLKLAREKAGYFSVADAGRRLRHIKPSTLASNENGNRDISRKMAEVYGRAFNVDPGWILYGTGYDTNLPSFGYSKETIISVARELLAEGILPGNDDNDTVVLAFLELCDQHARKISLSKTPLDLLKRTTEE